MLYHCFASFKQSLLDFFKLVDSRLILMLSYDSNSYDHRGSPIISGLLRLYLRRGLDNVQDVPVVVKL